MDGFERFEFNTDITLKIELKLHHKIEIEINCTNHKYNHSFYKISEKVPFLLRAVQIYLIYRSQCRAQYHRFMDSIHYRCVCCKQTMIICTHAYGLQTVFECVL